MTGGRNLVALQLTLLVSYLQLEKMIGKLKAEKYGEKILDEIKCYESKNERDESAGRSVEKKNNKALVVLESSEDEA